MSVEQYYFAHQEAIEANLASYHTDLYNPNFEALLAHYPKYGPAYDDQTEITDQELAPMIGGKVQYNIDHGFFQNTCAIRVSHAMNLSLNHIPYIEGQISSSANFDSYIYRVKVLEQHLTEVYGPAHIISNDYKDFLGYTGIIIFNTDDLWLDASGHSSLWNKYYVLGGNYSADFYFSNSTTAKLWVVN